MGLLDKRVLLVSTWFPSERDITEGSFVLADAKNLQKHGVNLLVVHLNKHGLNQTETYEGIKVVRIPLATSKPHSIVKAAVRVLPYIKRSDLLHTHAISSLLPLVLLPFNKPWVHTEHWSGLTTSAHRLPAWKRFILPQVLKVEKRPDVSVAVVEFLARPLRKIRGGKDTRVIPVVVPSPDQIVPRPNGKLTELVSIGGLVPGKDPIMAVETLALLVEQGENFHLTWVGDGPLREEVETKISATGAPVTLAGRVKPQEVPGYIENADMFFGPTRGDNFFTSAAESIVRGRPVVAGANGGHSEYLDPKVSELVSEGSPENFASAIKNVHEKTKKMTEAEIAATVGNRFSADTVATQYMDLYRSLLTH
ncbi:hypothetical protein BSR29_00775 [Boudabousia liubingyangii]|uniref:Glycosyltransferase subfamily 4-like N-terminal domain-containing protein n=1 Tax=Boudabousia liubingyangii TaxID=1921764 RepID=A0A1Q5PPS1_9ACTO|nr:glycosyltransferase family 4 protein [Boudabousia liubingyangii]OKL49523.1 hypothetical protein BSR29_00775 [Boudabousia liubingyangii]